VRAVVDTNVLLAALLWRGPPHALLQHARSGALTLLSSPALLAELAEVLGRSKFDAILERTATSREHELAQLRRLAEVMEPPPSLYRSMREQGMLRVKFRYRLNRLSFECLFFADTEPYELVMGCLGHNFAIFVDVHRGFEIRPFIEPKQTYFALRDALFENADSGIKLEASVFFAEFNRHIPTHATPDQRPSPRDIGKYYPDLEDSDKLFFCGWLDNNKQRNRVRPENLAKTLRLMGQRAHDFALRRNQSTRWTDDETKAVTPVIPE
jgi:putative PIN family toxin of toxin-antitoxin system